MDQIWDLEVCLATETMCGLILKRHLSVTMGGLSLEKAIILLWLFPKHPHSKSKDYELELIQHSKRRNLAVFLF